MPNPWDRPPLPTYGDLDAEKTFASVGAMSTAWETIEFDLCVIFSTFCGDPIGEAMRLYGSNRSFPGRLDGFSRKAEEYFVHRPDQNREAQLHQLLTEVRGFVERRNEVIHGIVVQINNLNHFVQYLTDKSPHPIQFALVPPYHMERSHGDDGLPLYAYNEEMIDQMVEKIANLHSRLLDFQKALVV